MTPVPAPLATLFGLVILFVPGLTFLALLGPRRRDALRLDEALWLAVAVSVAVSA